MNSTKEVDPERILDAHVHYLGDGSSGNGCYVNFDTARRRWQGRLLLKFAGIHPSAIKNGLDKIYKDFLVTQVKNSNLNGAVLFAQDWPHDSRGKPLYDKAAFYTPNDAVLQICREHPDLFVPAFSIHPARKDALYELDRCLEAGARIIKLLPNVHGVDCMDSAYEPFWKKLAKAGGILIAHTGTELSLPVINRDWEDPRKLARPLDCGVRVIAAHCGGRSVPMTRDYTKEWIAMLTRHPHLYGDTSALALPNRARTLRKLLPEKIQERLIHGSDFPIPNSAYGPWMYGLLAWTRARELSKIKNPLERDYQIKKAIGFKDSVFRRLDGLLHIALP